MASLLISSVAWTPLIANKVAGWVFGKVAWELVNQTFNPVAMITKIDSKKDLIKYESQFKSEVNSELRKTTISVSQAMNYTIRSKEKKLNRRLFNNQKKISTIETTIKRNVLEFEKLDRDDIRRLKTISAIILTNAISSTEKINDFNEYLEYDEKDKLDYTLKLFENNVRGLELLLRLRNSSSITQMSTPQMLNMFEEKYPEIFNQIWGVNILQHFMDSNSSKSYDDAIISVSQNLYNDKGSMVSMESFYEEFKKAYPGIKITIPAMTKKLNSLAEQGAIGGIEDIGGYKMVLIKPIELTNDIQTVLSLVAENEKMQYEGISIPEIMTETSWSEEYTSRVLETTEKKELSRKTDTLLEGTKYHFSSLLTV